MWIYLWAFYFVPLIYISVFVPVPYCLNDCGFVVETEINLTGEGNDKPLQYSCLENPMNTAKKQRFYITLPTKVHIVKAMVFPVVMY